MNTSFVELMLVLNLGVSLAALWRVYTVPLIELYMKDKEGLDD